MTANELRIGNYVQDNGHVKQIIAIDENSVMVSKQRGYTLHSIDPIPLTVEWLENHCNGSQFTSDPQERNASKAYWFVDLIVHQVNENEDAFFVYLMDHGYRDREYTINLKYVHQLQNLYHSLKQVELTLTT